MLTHAEIWKAVDALAAANGLSPSGLAKKAGLDPTTFNKSKRKTGDGKLRWPSTESISKILAATGRNLYDLVGFMENKGSAPRVQRIPVIGYAQAGKEGFFDDAGYPTGSGWDEITFPEIGDPHAYALEISGNSMEPLYRDGDVIIVSPASNPRRGDRVVVKTHKGEVMAKEMARRTATHLELFSLNPDHEPRHLDMGEVEWVARIIWASQ